jgi:putative spermidine/putrescine transport system permease protein
LPAWIGCGDKGDGASRPAPVGIARRDLPGRAHGDHRADVVLEGDLVRVSAAGLLDLLPAAFGFVRYRFHGKSMLNLVMMLPIIVPAVVSALGYYSFLSPLRLVGTHAGMIVAHSVLSIPVAFLVVAAALKGFDRNLERAAMSAGAGPLRTFLWVTLPVLRPAILVGALFAFLHSFNEAVVAIFIAGRDASTLPKKMFESIRLESDPVIAVVSTLLTGAVLLGVLISLFFRQQPPKGERYAA